MSLTMDSGRGGLLRGRRVAVVGGGLGGLAAALACARRGADVALYERAPEIAEVGAGIQVSPNGLRVLSALGLDEVVAAASVVAQAVEPMDAISGRPVTRFDLTRLDGPAYRLFHRADLIALLAEACRAAGVMITLGAEMDASGLPEADLVIGAEGIHSTLRPALGNSEDAAFMGAVAWRAVIARPDAEPVVRVWMAPGRHAVTYPMTRDRFNIVAVQERSQWAAEGWQHADDPGNMRAAFAGLSGRLTGLLAQVDRVALWGLFRHPVATVWHKDNVVILGDAAHPTLPFLAQGANMAFEDAWVLAACADRMAVPEALAEYQRLRRPRVSRAIAAANANKRNYHLRGPARIAAHLALKTMGAVAPTAYMGRLDWLYQHDVTAG